MNSARLGELERRLSNIIRPGKVLSADYQNARVKVQVGKNETAWLPWMTGRAGGDRTWHPPEVGEQVLVLAPAGDMAIGYVLPSIYQNAHPAPADSELVSRTEFADGAILEYAREAHTWKLEIPHEGRATISIGQGKLEVSDTAVSLSAGEMKLEVSAAGIAIRGPVTQTGGNLMSNGIGLQTHVHPGVVNGTELTSMPI